MNLKNSVPSDNIIDCTPHAPTVFDALIEHMPIILIFFGLCMFIVSIKLLSSELRLWWVMRRIKRNGPAYYKYETYTESLNPTKHSDYP